MRMYTGDLKPDLQVTCSADEPVDLDDAVSVRIIGRRDDTIVFDSTPDTQTVVGDTTVVTRLWQPGDTAETGRIQIEVEATWPGNKKQTFRANGGVDIHRDFDAAALEAADPPPLETVVSDASINAVLVEEGTATRATITEIIDTAVEDAVEAHTPGIELGYAERTTNYSNTQTAVGASALITGLTFDIVGQGRPIDYEFNAPSNFHSVANTPLTFYVAVNGDAVGTRSHSGTVSSPGTTSPGRNICLRRRVVLDDGVTYTFTVGVFGGAAGTNNVRAATFAPVTFTATSR